MSAINGHGGWPGRNTPLAAPGADARPAIERPQVERIVAADYPDQRIVPFAPAVLPHFLRVAPGHQLPIVVYDAKGQPVARFAAACDAVVYLAARRTCLPGQRLTLPLPIAEALAAAAAGPAPDAGDEA